MMNEEKQKFRRFYLYGSILWLIILGAVGLGSWINAYAFPEKSYLLGSILHTFLVFGVFGIPIIFILSLFIRLVAYIVDKIPNQKP